MKKELVPYYASRAVASAAISLVVFGFGWKAAICAVLLFSVFLLYLHSGWFAVDTSHPWAPVTRDARGREVQRSALVAAVLVGIAAHVASGLVPYALPAAAVSGQFGFKIGVATYFVAQFALLSR